MKRKKRTFSELVKENRQALMQDKELMDRIEERLEKRHLQKAE